MSGAQPPRRPRRDDDEPRTSAGAEDIPFAGLYDLRVIEAVLFAGAMEEEVYEEEREERPEGGDDPNDPRPGGDEDG